MAPTTRVERLASCAAFLDPNTTEDDIPMSGPECLRWLLSELAAAEEVIEAAQAMMRSEGNRQRSVKSVWELTDALAAWDKRSKEQG